MSRATTSPRKLSLLDATNVNTAKKPVKPANKKNTNHCKRRCEILSYFVGCGCVVGLGLSGIDSALAVQQFMHQPMWRASMLAVVVDGLMVGAELTTIMTKCPLAKKYATWYILGAGGLSILLNGAEFASGASGFWHRTMNAVVGGLIPLLVLVSSKYAGHLYLSSK